MFSAEFRFQGENPFDILAELIQITYSNEQEGDNLFEKSESMEVLNHVEEFVRENPAFSGGAETLYAGIPPGEAAAMRRWPYLDSFSHALELLKRLDRALDISDILKSEYVKSLAGKGFEALNGNGEETGLSILPRLETINDIPPPEAPPEWERKYADAFAPGINRELKNTFYVERRELALGGAPCRAVHHILPGAFMEKNLPLVIAASPLLREDILFIRRISSQEKNGPSRNRFSVEGLTDPELVKTRLLAAFRCAVSAGAGILVFPEMLGCEEFTKPDFFEQLRASAEPDAPLPWLTLLPTWWHDRRNELYILDGAGRALCVQKKLTPFEYKEGGIQYLEDIDRGDPVVHVLHIEGLGRVTFPICRDLLHPDIQHLLVDVLKSTLLLCPSYSQHKAEFNNTAVHPVAAGAYTLWLNTCAAGWRQSERFEYVGLFSGPMEENVRVRLCPKCGWSCGAADEPCVFFVTLDTTEPWPAVTCAHNR